MISTFIDGLQATREQLLKQFMLSKGHDRTELLTRIMDVEEQIEEEQNIRHAS